MLSHRIELTQDPKSYPVFYVILFFLHTLQPFSYCTVCEVKAFEVDAIHRAINGGTLQLLSSVGVLVYLPIHVYVHVYFVGSLIFLKTIILSCLALAVSIVLS